MSRRITKLLQELNQWCRSNNVDASQNAYLTVCNISSTVLGDLFEEEQGKHYQYILLLLF